MSFKWSKNSNQANLVDFTHSLLSILEWKDERVFLNKNILSGKASNLTLTEIPFFNTNIFYSPNIYLKQTAIRETGGFVLRPKDVK